MARLVRIPVRSLGSDAATPAVPELAGWVEKRKGLPGDLTTYLLEKTLLPQAEVEFPCAGGSFYRARILESLQGIEGGVLVREPSVETLPLEEDARLGAAARKGLRFAIPAPHSLGITDGYYHDPDEFCTGLITVYRALMRAMRDAGAGGHVLLGEKVLVEELEGLTAPRTFFYYPDLTGEELPALLEHQGIVAAGAKLLPGVLERLDEFRIRSLVLVDGGEEDLRAAAEHLDPDRISLGGYCRKDCGEYWKGLTARAVLRR